MSLILDSRCIKPDKELKDWDLIWSDEFDSDKINRPSLNNAIGLKSWLLSSPECYCSPAIVPEENLHKYLGAVDQDKNYFRWEISINQKDLINNIKNFFLSLRYNSPSNFNNFFLYKLPPLT